MPKIKVLACLVPSEASLFPSLLPSFLSFLLPSFFFLLFLLFFLTAPSLILCIPIPGWAQR